MSLAEQNHGFRSAYLDYAGLTTQVQAWAEAYPELVRLETLGTTPEGRSQWLLVIGREPTRVRPAAWVDGNMHASELAGSSVALSIAEDVLSLHLTGGVHDLPRAVTERLREVLFYVLPRMSPDGAERVLTSGRYVRSVPRDIDGDGLSLVMRVQDPGGEYVESAEVPGVMLQRQIDDEGPFYKLYPEGVIEHFDGHRIPTPHFLDDNPIDLNRNFPWSWAPPHEQVGAGPFAASEPEARHVVEFATRHPEIFAWLNLHTFGGVAIRPLGHAPDSKMDAYDRAVFHQVEAWIEEYTGYPTVSGFHEFLYEPDKPLHGDLTDYAYHQRGALAYVIELWDLFARLGLPRPKRFVEYYERLTSADLLKLARWDREHNGGRVFLPWRPFQHPQLGPVTIGGLDPRIGVWNPSLEALPEVCTRQSQAFLRVASLSPDLSVAHLSVAHLGVSALGVELRRVELRVENRGYLPTTFLPSAKQLDFNEPVHVDCVASGGAVLVDEGQAHVVLGHLDGWGRGLNNGVNAAHYQRSRGNTHSARVVYLVQGSGTLRFRLGSCRMGWTEASVEV